MGKGMLVSDIRPDKNLGFGSGSKAKAQQDRDSEFNSIHFGMEIKKKKKQIFETQKIIK